MHLIKKSLLAWVLLGCSGVVFGAVTDLSVTNYQLVEKTRINRSDYEYVYAITLRNTAGALENVTATVGSSSSKTTINDAIVFFGTISSGDTLSGDTFSFIQDRRLQFNASALKWTFTGDEPTAINTAPVADAGEDQTLSAGSVVNLDGSGSSDFDNDTLSYSWMLSAPSGSAAALGNPAVIAPSFTADVAGVYTATLVVNDGTDDSNPDSVSITVNQVNTPPVANAGADQTIDAGSLAQLNGSASSDADGDTLSFSWELSRPAGSAAVLSDSSIVNPDFIADIAGLYSVALSVSDGAATSAVDTMVIQANEGVFNSPPVLQPIADVTMAPNVLLVVTAVGSDPDNGDTLMYSLASAPLGMVIVASSGEITWTPDDTQLGTVNVVVQVSDTAGLSDAQSFEVTVVSDNAPPIARDDSYRGTIGVLLSEPAPGVMTNDSDPNGDATAATLVAAPASGTAVLEPDGGFTYLYEPVAPVPVDIELETHCSTVDLHPLLPGNGPIGQVAVGDVDNDGETEIVATNFSRFFILDAATCALEYQHLPSFSTATEPKDSERWASRFFDSAHVGMADLDGDGDLEIVGLSGGITNNSGIVEFDIFGHLVALHHDGSFVWNRPVAPGLDPRLAHFTPMFRNPAHPTAGIVDWRGTGPSFADLDGDGRPEIIMGFYHDDQTTGSGSLLIPGVVAFNGIDGSIKWVFYGSRMSGQSSRMAHVADLDLDGTPEIIFGHYVLDHNGNLEFSLQLDDEVAAGVPRRVESAIANFDNDAFGEILVRHEKSFYVFEHDGTRKWKKVFSTAAGVSTAVDEITVGDFDGDGQMEFTHRINDGTAARYQVVYDTDGSEMWSHFLQPQYHSNQFERPQAVTAFDVNDDGADDIVADLRVDALTDDPALGFGDAVLFAFNGNNGTELFRARSYQDSSTSVFPVIADLDQDGEAEILLSGQRPLNAAANGDTPFHIYQGKSSSPLPPAPRISNQWSFNAAYVNLDGSTPVNPIPHWLVPQMNGFHKVPTVVDVHKPRAVLDSFTYKISDGLLDSNTATVNLAISPPMSPPVILSNSIRFATQDTPYIYGVIAADPDAGDTLSFFLTVAPTGMTIDPATHLIHWTPGAADLGDHSVTVIVQDSDGLADIQSFTVTVAVPAVVPNVIGQTKENAQVQIEAVKLLLGNIEQVFDATTPIGNVIAQMPVAGTVVANGSKVNLVVSKGPGPLDSDDDGDGLSENEGDCNDTDSTTFPGAADTRGDGIDQNCDGVDGLFDSAEIFIAPNMPLLLVGQSINLTATAVLADRTSVDITLLGIWSSDNAAVVQSNGDGAFVTTGAGSTLVRVTHMGFSASIPVTVAATTPGDTTPPTAEITSPERNATVTAPSGITGTATDANFFKYVLDMAPAGETNYTVIQQSDVAVTAGVLGQFDPTLLLNDLYSVRLRVYDTGGNISTVESVYQVDGDMKVGNFSLTFTDLQIPMSGIPITVNRTYDSRDKRKGDFGIGWHLDVQTLSIRANRELGTGWQVLKQGLNFRLAPTDEHKVSLTLPSGRVEVFDMIVLPLNSPLVPFPPFANRTVFQPRPGTTGSLLSLENNNLTILDPQPGFVSLLDDTTNNPYNPDRFRYTASDGTVIVVSKASGVKSIREPNGSTLTFNDLGIFHSAGKRALFVRDTDGRIVKLIDPNGNEQFYSYSSNGDLATHVDQESNTTSFTYNQNHGLLDIVDPLGNRALRNEYNEIGRLIASVDAMGNRIEYQHDIASQEEQIIDQLGNVTLIQYDDRGNVLSQVKALGESRNYTYDADDRLLSETDPLGGITRHTYDSRGNRLSTTDALGNKTDYTYNSRDQITSVTDPLGNTSRQTYDATGINLLTETDGLGNVTTYSYNSAGNLKSISRPGGSEATRNYDVSGNLLTEVNGNGVSSNYSYDANGNRRTETRSRTTAGGSVAEVTSYTYDAVGRRTQKIGPDGSIFQVNFDAGGRKSSLVDANGEVIEFKYDELGNLTHTYYSDGSLRGKTYDAARNLLSVTDPNGNTVNYSYDALGRLASRTAPDGSVTHLQYNLLGQIVATTDSEGWVTASEFDDLGNQTRVTDAQGNQTLYSYDSIGNLLSTTNAAGHVTSFTYDALGRMTSTIFPDSSVELVTYDGRGNVLTKMDALGNTTQFSYDAMDRLTKVTDALGQVTTYAYDEVGNKVTQTDANGNMTGWEYDSEGRVLRKVLPLGMFDAYSYDSAGNVISHTDAAGDTTTMSYDTRGRLTGKTFAGGGSETFTYSANGQVASFSNGLGTTTNTYDSRDQLISQLDPDGSSILYAYDSVGNVTSVTTASGSTSTTYDGLRRPKTVTGPDDGVTSYIYDQMGNRASVTLPNGSVTSYSYDGLNRLIALEHRRSNGTLLDSATYTLDTVGNRVRVVEGSGRSKDYSYDAVYQLLQEAVVDSVLGNETTSYSYDANGNRLSRTDDAGTWDSSYDANDRLVEDGVFTYTYDTNGNTLSKASGAQVIEFSYDAENLLSGLPNLGVSYEYDANGVLRRIDDNGAITKLIVDTNRELSQVIEERDDTGAELVTYVHGDDLISQHRFGVASYYLYDGSMSTRSLLDINESETDAYVYDAFGNLENASGSTINRYLYTGESIDDASGLYHLRARDYDPLTGRFISADTFPADERLPSTLNRYTYVGNNPINFVDPTGQFLTSVELSVSISIEATLQKAYGNLLGNSLKESTIIANCLIEPGTQIRDSGFELITDPYLGHVGIRMVVQGNEIIAAGLNKINLAFQDELKNFGDSLIPKFSTNRKITAKIPAQISNLLKGYQKVQDGQKKFDDVLKKVEEVNNQLIRMEDLQKEISKGNFCAAIDLYRAPLTNY